MKIITKTCAVLALGLISNLTATAGDNINSGGEGVATKGAFVGFRIDF